ncbi:phage baseplate assembly protein domain-containing protein [Serratia sp. CY76391]|uniref:phage baseplate assembly protein domain-containing protein n=1 Tax=Serratia sp. CY76391 TaxID=3383681 RepID=UPI003FA1786A
MTDHLHGLIQRLWGKVSALDSKISTLYRRAMMTVTMAKVTASSDGGAVQSLQTQTPMEVKGDTPRLTEFGFSSGLPTGADVVILCPNGDRSNAIVIASGHAASRHSGLNPGETVIFNQWGQYIKLTEDGIEVQANGKVVGVKQATQVNIEASEGATVTGPFLKCTGDVIDNCDSNTTTLKQLREAFNQHNHLVKNVQGGNADITSEQPGDPVQ